MLRYDFCAPVNFKLERIAFGHLHIVKNDESDPQLIVARATVTKDPQWTKGRWASFQWNITLIKTLKIKTGV